MSKVFILRLALDGPDIEQIDARELEREIAREGLGTTLVRHELIVDWSDGRWDPAWASTCGSRTSSRGET